MRLKLAVETKRNKQLSSSKANYKTRLKKSSKCTLSPSWNQNSNYNPYDDTEASSNK